MIFDDIFNGKKKKEQEKEKEKLHQERQAALDATIDKSSKLQEKVLELQKSNMEIAWKNEKLNEELVKLVTENDRTKNILLERENKIKEKQDELDERQKGVRQEEIESTARKAEVRKNEQQLAEQQKNLDKESERVTVRETEAEKVKTESESAKEKYETLHEELEVDKDNINTLEEAARRKNEEADEKIVSANAIFDKSKVIDDEIKAKEAKFEEHRESIEKALNEKIAEYDRRLEDLNAVKGIVDDIKFDDSEDGKQAKIVVKEAIRQAKKALTDIKTSFEELDEKYSSGTFKGFATPLSEIDKDFEALKTQYIQVKDHIASQVDLPASFGKWLNHIEECIINAEKYRKSWEFSEAYRNIIWGLATCKNYELILTIFYGSDSTNEDENTQQEEENFNDWYEILGVEPDANEKEIKKAYRDVAKKHHPDKNQGDKESEEKFKKAAEAYEILSDKAKREAFDEKRKNRKQKNNNE